MMNINLKQGKKLIHLFLIKNAYAKLCNSVFVF